jgi:hypothetical protein
MLVSFFEALVKPSKPGPMTILGRWCGPWYSKSCNVMNKGWLADADNSVWDGPPPKVDDTPVDQEKSRAATSNYKSVNNT